METKDLLKLWVDKAISERNDPRKIFDSPEEVEKYLMSCGVLREECSAIKKILASGQLDKLIDIQPIKVSYKFYRDCLQKTINKTSFSKKFVTKVIEDVVFALGGSIQTTPKKNVKATVVLVTIAVLLTGTLVIGIPKMKEKYTKQDTPVGATVATESAITTEKIVTTAAPPVAKSEYIVYDNPDSFKIDFGGGYEIIYNGKVLDVFTNSERLAILLYDDFYGDFFIENRNTSEMTYVFNRSYESIVVGKTSDGNFNSWCLDYDGTNLVKQYRSNGVVDTSKTTTITPKTGLYGDYWYVSDLGVSLPDKVKYYLHYSNSETAIKQNGFGFCDSHYYWQGYGHHIYDSGNEYRGIFANNESHGLGIYKVKESGDLWIANNVNGGIQNYHIVIYDNGEIVLWDRDSNILGTIQNTKIIPDFFK